MGKAVLPRMSADPANRPKGPVAVKDEIRRLARETDLSIRKIKKALSADVSRGVVGSVVKDVRSKG